MPCEPICRLTAEEERLWQERLSALLARRIALYTANGSSSVPLAVARELLRGVLFCLAVPEEHERTERAARIRVLLSSDPEEALAQGRRRAAQDAEKALMLWRRLMAALPPLENRALRDTVSSIGQGFRRYDARFFPHRFTCTIDYPLAHPVLEGLPEIHYVAQYMLRLAAENALLTRLPDGAVRTVLERSCPDWRGLVVTLYTPVAADTLARTILGGGECLTLTDGEVEMLRARWEHVRPAQLEGELLRAADVLTERLALPRLAARYLRASARETALRAAALRDCGGLRGIFV